MKKIRSLQPIAFGCLGILGILSCFLTACNRPAKSGKTLRANSTLDISPDGKRLVFVGAGQGGADLYLFDLNTQHVTRLTNTPENEIYPRFSPDGKQIVFSSALPGFDANGYIFEQHLYVYDLASGNIQQITHDTNRWDYCPAYSSDGKYIVFDGAIPKTLSHYTSDIYVLEVKTGQCHRLTQEAYNSMLYPRFWQNNSAILFTALKNTEPSKGAYQASVALKNPQKPTPITPLGAKTSAAQPLPGDKILLISDIVGNLDYKICLFDLKTGTYDVLATSNTGPCSPVAFGNTVYWFEGYNDLRSVDLITRKTRYIANLLEE